MLLSQNSSSILGGDLPPAVYHRLTNPPRAGGGVHNWLFTTALVLYGHRSPEAIEQLLATAVKGCGRQVSAHEISDAVNNSAALVRGGDVSIGQGALPRGSRGLDAYHDIHGGVSKPGPSAASSCPAS